MFIWIWSKFGPGQIMTLAGNPNPIPNPKSKPKPKPKPNLIILNLILGAVASERDQSVGEDSKSARH